jgi:hypothetical protein
MVVVALTVLALMALVPASAAADGLPAVGIDARPLSTPRGDVEYTTERAGADTRLVESARYGGPLRRRTLRGSLSIPAVAYDGSPGGLSADGRTLMLISPRTRYPRRRTTFAVVDARRLAVRRRIHLKGDFSFDALSPNGRVMYLIQYASRDFSSYAVRAYDLRARRLFRDPVVDPREADEPMTGAPVTRVASADSRWAYTLYDSSPHPFVHALDTARRTAVCIDLDGIGGGIWGAALQLRGPTLAVVGRRGMVLATIDTRTHRLIADPEPAAEDAATSWLPIAVPTAAVLLLGAALSRRRRRLYKARAGRGPTLPA